LTLGLALVTTFVFVLGERRIGRRWLALGLVPFGVTLITNAPLAASAVSYALRTHALAAPLRLGDTTLPAGTFVTIPNGSGDWWYLVHAGSGTVATAHVPITGDFEIYPDGVLDGLIMPAVDPRIDGVPCAGRHIVSIGGAQPGRLTDCLLSGPYRYAGITFEAGTDADFGFAPPPEFIIGTHPPSLRVKGRALEPLDKVTVTSDEILIDMPENRPLGTSAACCTDQVRYNRSKHVSETNYACPGPNSAQQRYAVSASRCASAKLQKPTILEFSALFSALAFASPNASVDFS
jgi:hypothetical protein